MSQTERPLVIIHGWSDGATSFTRLARLILDNSQRQAISINLADYVSMDDEVTFDDIVTAMMRAWQQKKLPLTPFAVDVLVHSTGGLIIRDWLTRFFSDETAPIKHLVMLAPANFGSQLAHRGRAFYGRVVKGFKGRKLFHVGAKLLKDLELASPYTWQLAMKDLFGTQCFYEPGKILCTVIIGNNGFNGISAAANELGSDGAIRISCANLNSALLTIDYSQNPTKPSYLLRESEGQIAFAVIDDENHNTVVAKDRGPKNNNTLKLILKALSIGDDKFTNFCAKLMAKNYDLYEQYAMHNRYKHGFQNTVVFVNDQFNNHVQDYFLEFYRSKKGKGDFEAMFYQKVIRSVHAYQLDPSYRSIYIDCTQLNKTLLRDLDSLHVSLIATPEYQHKRSIVGYKTFKPGELGAIAVPKKEIGSFFSANRTLLVNITLKREQADEVFTFHNGE